MLEQPLEIDKEHLKTFFNQYLQKHTFFKTNNITKQYITEILNISPKDYLYAKLKMKIAGNLRPLLNQKFDTNSIEIWSVNQNNTVYKIRK